MSFEAAIVARLNAVSGVTDLVSDRISFGSFEVDPDRGYIALRRLATVPGNTVNTRDALTDVLFEANCIAPTFSGAKAIADQVRPALENFKGTISGQVIKGIYWKDEQHISPATGSRLYRIAQFYSVWGDQS